MPRRSPEYMQKQRLRFCEAAMACFRRKGVIASNLTDICEEARLSMGALYKHFTSREELLEAVLQLLLTRRNEAIVGATWAELRGAIMEYREELAQNNFWRELDGMVAWNTRLKQVRVREARTILKQLEGQLTRYTASAEISPPFDAQRTGHLISLIVDGSLSNVRSSSEVSVTPEDLAAYLDWAVGSKVKALQGVNRRRGREARSRRT